MAADIYLSQQSSSLRASYDLHLPEENTLQQLLPRSTVRHEIILNAVKSQLSAGNLPRTAQMNYNLKKHNCTASLASSGPEAALQLSDKAKPKLLHCVNPRCSRS